MAGANRKPFFNLKNELLEKPKTFSFFQSMRLLRYFLAREEDSEEKGGLLQKYIRIRPKLALSHPGADIDDIEVLESDQPKYKMTVNFLGLYGESSPLPTFYTEDLLDDDGEEKTAARDLIDIINHPLYTLLNQSYTKYRVPIKLIDEKDAKYKEILFSLLGIGVEEMREGLKDADELLRYTGLLTQQPKSARGLERLLKDVLDIDKVEIDQCVERVVKIPPEQHLIVGKSGNVLGGECYLGETIKDRMKKFRIKLGPVDADKYLELLPGGEEYEKIIFYVDLYLFEPLESELEIFLDGKEVKTARLSNQRWSRLGMDTWMFSGEHDKPVSTVFNLT